MNNVIKQNENHPLVTVINELQLALQNGSNYEISKKNNKTIVKIDSENGGSRSIYTHERQGGYENKTKIDYVKGSIEERRELVKKLDQEGKSQTEISSIVMTSQKTISNDLKVIKKGK